MHKRTTRATETDEPIVIEDYDPRWPMRFSAESRRLHGLLVAERPVIRHIGSTAVAGLPAKPIVDILLGFRSPATLDSGLAALRAAGYCYRPEYESVIPERRFLTVRRNGLDYNIHAVQVFGSFWFERLQFRDCLRSRPGVAAAYCELKHSLARQYGSDRSGYSNAKTAFVTWATQLAADDEKFLFSVNGLTEARAS